MHILGSENEFLTIRRNQRLFDECFLKKLQNNFSHYTDLSLSVSEGVFGDLSVDTQITSKSLFAGSSREGPKLIGF